MKISTPPTPPSSSMATKASTPTWPAGHNQGSTQPAAHSTKPISIDGPGPMRSLSRLPYRLAAMVPAPRPA